MDTTVVRLRAPIRVGHEIIPNNAVLELEASEADRLLDADPPCAEPTSAIERYPVPQPIFKVHDFPVWGTEKFPRDVNLTPPPHPSAFANNADRHAEDTIRASLAPAGPAGGSKEPAPAAILELSPDSRRRAEAEEQAAADARLAAAVPVVLVDDDAARSKGKAK